MKKRIITMVSICILSASVFIEIPSGAIKLHAASCETVEECEAEQERIQAEKSALESEIAQNEADKADLIVQMEAIFEQIKNTEASIDTLEKLIVQIEARIAVLEVEIAKIEEEIVERFAVQQKAGTDSSYLQLLMSSSSLTSMFNKMKVLEQFNTADQNNVNELDIKKAEQEDDKARNEQNKVESELEKANLVELRVQLSKQLEELKIKIAENHSDYNSLKTSEEDINKQKAILEGGIPSSNGWYIPAKKGILSCAVNCYSGHIGVDFYMVEGTPIYAAATGKVVYTETGFTGFSKGSFGNMVAISHNVNGTPYVTIYAHLSVVQVSPGDIVSGGEQIGLSGETGEAYGAHLHIEVLENIETFYYDKSVRIAHYINPLSVLPNPGNWQWSL